MEEFICHSAVRSDIHPFAAFISSYSRTSLKKRCLQFRIQKAEDSSCAAVLTVDRDNSAHSFT
jgi:hypothetical protein